MSFWLPTSLLLSFSFYTLSFIRYVRVQLCVHTRCDAQHTRFPTSPIMVTWSHNRTVKKWRSFSMNSDANKHSTTSLRIVPSLSRVRSTVLTSTLTMLMITTDHSQILLFPRNLICTCQTSTVRCQQNWLFVKCLDARSFKSHVLLSTLCPAFLVCFVYFLRCHCLNIEVFELRRGQPAQLCIWVSSTKLLNLQMSLNFTH